MVMQQQLNLTGVHATWQQHRCCKVVLGSSKLFQYQPATGPHVSDLGTDRKQKAVSNVG